MAFTAEAMPTSKRKLVEIKINVPENLLEKARRVFEAIGITDGDGHRDAWIAGVYHMIECENKALVNEKLLNDSAKTTESEHN